MRERWGMGERERIIFIFDFFTLLLLFHVIVEPDGPKRSRDSELVSLCPWQQIKNLYALKLAISECGGRERSVEGERGEVAVPSLAPSLLDQ
jgi:hypothetical protein